MTAPHYPNGRGRVQPAAVLLAGLLLTLACGTSEPVAKRRFSPSPGLRQQGLASYYADALAGRPTASGEPYRPGLLTAAHRALPLGTRVRVIRLDRNGNPSGPTVVVRINDRGPFGGRGRIIDVSRAAARRLRMIGPGVVKVQLEVLEVPSRKRRRRP